ncbi:UDP-glucose 4-epimerase GalE [Luteolibacter ambystomatis]|uniref:UDP-glucose 4-epimerase n=1 Tax=Luteolibacter ambystomatis TaxID=2824561 RepID=A0A975IXT3_9BACT|nr:UDP-glucose 4-epimerase GalE [Luteolibacter ambystomatis]QUE49409.1 UDP-glucose 4-epimerase GalE [Luteolibacter ambystomatis]
MPESILVTGGAGYIGSHTVRLLASQGRKIVVLDNLVYGHEQAIVDESVTLMKGDVGDRALVERLFEEYRFTAVVHFAAYAYVGESVTDPLKYYRNNTAEPLVLLETMQKHGCKVFVFSSTCATYGVPDSIPIVETNPQRPINPYGRSKLMLEWVLADCGHAWGLRSACLRYFNASGSSADGLIGEDHDPETHLIPRVLMAVTGEIEYVEVFGTDYDTPDGTGVRDYIHVEDLAEAHALALDHLAAGGESLKVNLGTGVGVSVKEIIEAVEEITGNKVPVKYGPRRAGDPDKLIADPSQAKSLLGWEARRKDVRDMVRPAWAWANGPRKGRYDH